jgi:hypothetical protein
MCVEPRSGSLHIRQFSLVIAVVSTLYVSLAWSQSSQPLRVIPLNIMWQTQPSSVPPDRNL